jgi:hypothetical protein
MKREDCAGYEDPEERCPESAKDCVCWQGRLGPQNLRERPIFWFEAVKFKVERWVLRIFPGD